MPKRVPTKSAKAEEPVAADDDLIPGIPDTLENIARSIVTTPPKKPHQWKFLQGRSAREKNIGPEDE
ncbi:MAG: hypothetical protein OXC69_02835 [Candidatus Tectomicrobia bacterium]|nr:hypothetical protein [Candidatus Tectomicrobia bacterium]